MTTSFSSEDENKDVQVPSRSKATRKGGVRKGLNLRKRKALVQRTNTVAKKPALEVIDVDALYDKVEATRNAGGPADIDQDEDEDDFDLQSLRPVRNYRNLGSTKDSELLVAKSRLNSDVSGTGDSSEGQGHGVARVWDSAGSRVNITDLVGENVPFVSCAIDDQAKESTKKADQEEMSRPAPTVENQGPIYGPGLDGNGIPTSSPTTPSSGVSSPHKVGKKKKHGPSWKVPSRINNICRAQAAVRGVVDLTEGENEGTNGEDAGIEGPIGVAWGIEDGEPEEGGPIGTSPPSGPVKRGSGSAIWPGNDNTAPSQELVVPDQTVVRQLFAEEMQGQEVEDTEEPAPPNTPTDPNYDENGVAAYDEYDEADVAVPVMEEEGVTPYDEYDELAVSRGAGGGGIATQTVQDEEGDDSESLGEGTVAGGNDIATQNDQAEQEDDLEELEEEAVPVGGIPMTQNDQGSGEVGQLAADGAASAADEITDPRYLNNRNNELPGYGTPGFVSKLTEYIANLSDTES